MVKNSLGVLLCLCSLLSFPLSAAPSQPYEDDFRLLTFNVFFLPRIIQKQGQQTRAELIAQAEFMKGQDLIILNELFDGESAATLLNRLKEQYPHQTPILAEPHTQWDASLGVSHPLSPGNGGVALVSRWPILEKIQYIYKNSCGSDGFSRKGFVYVKLEKQGRPYHVIGTHAQSEAIDCHFKTAASVRASQFDEIRNFISSRHIPSTELLFIGGDLNVIKDTDEYQDMLKRLNVLEPNSYAGHYSTWDALGNGLAFYQYPDYEHPEYLDYIFVSAAHGRPSYWHNQALDIPSPRWAEGNYYHQEYSDHYPVQAFAYADASTPRQSFRAGNLPYANIHLKHEASGRYVSALGSNNWLTITATEPGLATAFNLDNWYPAKRPFCVRSGDFVQLSSQQYPGHYWNWYLGFSGNYGYYLKDGDSSNQLRLVILNDHGSCLKNGDLIAFVDRDTLKGRDAYIQLWSEGKWEGHMFLWSDSIGPQEIFEVEMTETPAMTDWSSRLRFRL